MVAAKVPQHPVVSGDESHREGIVDVWVDQEEGSRGMEDRGPACFGCFVEMLLW